MTNSKKMKDFIEMGRAHITEEDYIAAETQDVENERFKQNLDAMNDFQLDQTGYYLIDTSFFESMFIVKTMEYVYETVKGIFEFDFENEAGPLHLSMNFYFLFYWNLYRCALDRTD